MKERKVENMNMSTAIYVFVIFYHGVSFDYRLCNGPKNRKYVENGGSGTSSI